MVAHVLRLRLDLLAGSLRGDRTHVFRNVAGALFLVAATAVACWAILTMRDDSAAVAQVVSVLAGSALLVGVSIAPAVGGVVDQLDPRRFAVFGLEPRPLGVALSVGALVSVPTLAVLAIAVTMAIVWSAHGVSLWLAVPFAIIGMLTTVLVARVSMATGSILLQGRRGRELTGLLALAMVIVVVPVAVFLGSLDWHGVVPTQIAAIAQALQVTPFGAAWAVPGRVALGDVGGAWLSAGIAVVSLAFTVWLWLWLVNRLLTTIENPSDGRTRTGLGWFGFLPSTATGAVAARSLVYWMRDRRYIVNVAIVPVVSIIAVFPLIVAGVPAPVVALLPVPLMALFLGWLPHNDVAYDSTAIWLHIVSGVRGIADRLGRLLPIVLIGVPLLAIAIPICVAIYGRWALLPALVGVAANLFLAGLGLSSIASVLSPYPVTRPGDSPFQQPQRAGSGFGAQALALVGTIVLSIPSLWMGWLVLNESMMLSMRTMWVGIGTGIVVLILGVVLGGLLFDRRGSKIMEFAEAV